MIASLLKQVSELKGNKKPEIQSNLKRDLQELWAGLKRTTFLKCWQHIFSFNGSYIVFGLLVYCWCRSRLPTNPANCIFT